MAVIALIRWKVPYVSTDATGMLDQKLIAMPGAGKDVDGVWAKTTSGNDWPDMRENAFFKHCNYSTHD